jgi:hypothetical protein
MSIDFDKDIDRILAGPLTSAATLRPGLSTARDLRCFFHEDYYAAEAGVVDVNTTQPSAVCKPSDVADAAQGDQFTVEGRTFRVRRAFPDGSGWTVLLLHKENS